MPKNAPNADFPLGCRRTDWVRTCRNLLTGGSPWVTWLFIKREGSESTWETQPVFGKIWTNIPCTPSCCPKPPKLQVPWALSLVLSHVWANLKREPSAESHYPEWGRNRLCHWAQVTICEEVRKRAGRSGPSRQQACPGGSRCSN